MIKRQELLNDILDLYDYIDTLEKENERLKPYATTKAIHKSENELSDIDYKVLEIGKKSVLEKALYSWNKVQVKYDEDNGTYSTMSYINWLKRKIDYDDLPRFISFDDFAVYFDKELKDMYQKEKREAIEKEKKENE